jgi:hypothetical protein
MTKPSPAQIRTCIVRISKVAKEILQKEVDKNNSSIADELDKKLFRYECVLGYVCPTEPNDCSVRNDKRTSDADECEFLKRVVR